MSVRKILRHLSERKPKTNRGRIQSWPHDNKLDNSANDLATIPENNFVVTSRNTEGQRRSNGKADKIQDSEVGSIIREILTSYLEQFERYDHGLCSRLGRLLSDMIRSKVYEICGDNWKVVANVYVGAVRDQGIAVASQCTWIPECDKFASASFENDVLFAFGIVFAIFWESETT